jgi:acyl-homoserine lactone acylase PvdQ
MSADTGNGATGTNGFIVLIRHPLTRQSTPRRGAARRRPAAAEERPDRQHDSDSDNQAAAATFGSSSTSPVGLALRPNSPGQSGDSASPHYADLFNPWVEGRYFPAYFSREKILGAAERTIRLEPEK